MSEVTTLKAYELSDEQAAGIGMSAEEMESHFTRRMKESGITRRSLFGVLAMDARQFAANIQQDGEEAADCLIDLLKHTDNEIRWLKSHVSLMETGRARIIWALSQVTDGQEGKQ